MRILHLDTGREMRGGQWQVLRLIDGLAAAGVESTLLAREGAPLFVEARKHGWRVEPVSLTRAVLMARRHDLMHAHDARSHTLGAVVRSGRLVVAAARGVYSRVAVEVRAGGAISRGVGIREASADGRRSRGGAHHGGARRRPDPSARGSADAADRARKERAPRDRCGAACGYRVEALDRSRARSAPRRTVRLRHA